MKMTLRFGSFFVAMAMVGVLFAFLGVKYHFNFDGFAQMTLIPLLAIAYVLIMFPDAWKDFKNSLFFSHSTLKVVLIPTFLGFTMELIDTIYEFLPVLWGGHIIGIGSHQYNDRLNYFPARMGFLFTGIVGPFIEEFIFRYSLYSIFRSMLSSIVEINDQQRLSRLRRKIVTPFKIVYQGLYVEKRRSFVLPWCILIGYFFAQMHGPNAWSLWFYFPDGVIMTYLFIRYGFVASFLYHAAGNSTAFLCLKLVFPLFAPYLH